MSHSIAMGTRTADTSKNSSIAVYLTLPVIVKCIQVVVGVICFGIAADDLISNFQDLLVRSAAVLTKHEFNRILDFVQSLLRPAVNFDYAFIDQMTCRVVFLTVTTIFIAISLIQLTWFPASLFSGPIKSRIISGVIYHLISFGLHLVASLFLLRRINLLGTRFYNADLMRTVVDIGLFNAVLYLLSAILASWSFIGQKTRQRRTFFETNPAQPSPVLYH